MADGDTVDGTIEFLNIAPGTDPAEPEPAHEYIPEWYENLDYEKDTGRYNKTVKSCIPFMEAMTTGWIVPIPHDISLRFGEDGLSIEIEDNQELLEPHEMDQLGGDDNPMLPTAILKFRTPWVARTPEGYSTLFVPPINRAERRWSPYSGIIDTDEYPTTIDAPSLWTQPGFEGTIEKGTPLLQAIPFKRDAIGLDGRVRDATGRERNELAKHVNALGETDSLYQDNFWVPKARDKEISD
jgi:hypothetical protein